MYDSFCIDFPALKKWVTGLGFGDGDAQTLQGLRAALTRLPFKSDRPSAIICHTVKSKGIPFAENDPTWHHKSRIPPEQIAEIYQALGAE